MKKTYEFVVIGSGFGGAISACRLAQAGRSVCILERGKRWDKGAFPRTTGQVSGKAFWDEQKQYGFLEYKAFRRIDVIQGCGVGGGSLHYFNVHIRTPERVFQEPWPSEIARPVLDPYYDLAKDGLDARPLEPPVGLPIPSRTTAFMDAATAAGKNPSLVDIAVHTGPDRSGSGGHLQSACTYCGNCLLGCHVHAKNTLDLNYLALAESQHGAEIYPLHAVTYLTPAKQGGYDVHFQHLDPECPGQFEIGTVHGTHVIFSAGALGSTELLLKCRDEKGALPGLSNALGSRFSGNGDFLLAGTLGANRDVDPGWGPSITASADWSSPDHVITIEDLGLPDPLFWYLEGLLPSGQRLRDLLRFSWVYLLQTLGRSWGSTRVSREIDALIMGGRTTHFLPYLGIGTDAADGQMQLRNGAIDIQWQHRRSKALFREIENAMREMTRQLGGRYATSLLWRWPLRKLLTAHPLGGCPMGTRPDNSVVDHRGEVWGHPGLYVCDGSTIPTALGVNPSMTICALAERTAFLILHKREMRASDPQTPQNT